MSAARTLSPSYLLLFAYWLGLNCYLRLHCVVLCDVVICYIATSYFLKCCVVLRCVGIKSENMYMITITIMITIIIIIIIITTIIIIIIII